MENTSGVRITKEQLLELLRIGKIGVTLDALDFYIGKGAVSSFIQNMDEKDVKDAVIEYVYSR